MIIFVIISKILSLISLMICIYLFFKIRKGSKSIKKGKYLFKSISKIDLEKHINKYFYMFQNKYTEESLNSNYPKKGTKLLLTHPITPSVGLFSDGTTNYYLHIDDLMDEKSYIHYMRQKKFKKITKK